MRYILSIIILLICFGCSNNHTVSNNQTPDATLGNDLIAANFLMYADSLKTDSLSDQIKKSFNIYDDTNNKIVHIDAEELAEFQFDFFLPKLNMILNKRHFQLNIKRADDYETSNEVFINDEKIQLYTKNEIARDDFWTIASKAFFNKLNEQLKKQNLNESFYLLYSGNDLHALLLTEKQFNIIADKYKTQPKEIPYKP